MSKTLKNLYTKALRTGYANLNGRKREYGYIVDLESKYTFKYNQETGDLSLYHRGTKILTIGSLKASTDTFLVTADFGSGELETRVK